MSRFDQIVRLTGRKERTMLLTTASLVLVSHLAGFPASPRGEGPIAPPTFLFAQAPPPRVHTTPRVRLVRGADPRLRSKAIGACVGMVLGLMAGVRLGAVMDRSGGDSPGMRGALIGLPIGAAVGGILGWKLVR